jgi:hypothetical protein
MHACTGVAAPFAAPPTSFSSSSSALTPFSSVFAQATQDSDAFRRASCYTEKMDRVLRKHLPESFEPEHCCCCCWLAAAAGCCWEHLPRMARYEAALRCVFHEYTNVVRYTLSDTCSNDLLSWQEWIRLMDDLGWFDATPMEELAQFTRPDAALCFVWARMAVFNEMSKSDRSRFLQMDFEEFVEALIRVASIKLLPRRSEAKAFGFADVGATVLRLKASSRYEAFLQMRKELFDEEQALLAAGAEISEARPPHRRTCTPCLPARC